MASPIDTCLQSLGLGRIVSYIFCCGLAFFTAWLNPESGLAGERIDLSGWNAVENGRLPDHWQPLRFPSISSATSYEIVDDTDYGPVILAQSLSGAGGIVRSITVNPRRYQILNWSWKIEDTISGSSLVRKNGDDFPARMMISFETKGGSRKGLQDNVLCYVWATEDSVDSISVNPIHDHIMTVVAASGKTESGAWLELSRNIFDDYIQAFSEEPGRITGVALMTDSDNTQSEARAWYGPIWLSADSDPASSTAAER